MNETEDSDLVTVTISDDESEQYQTKWCRSNSLSYEGPSDPIVLDSPPSQRNNLYDNIEILDDPDIARRQTIQILSEDLRKKNRVLADLIETCIILENSDGMLRVLQRTLLRMYNEADEDYKKSKSCDKVIRKSYERLQNEPEHKFSLLKNLCDTLKFHKAKKRVQLTTLATNLKGNNEEKHKRKSNFLESPPKKQKMVDIVLSESEDSDIISIKDSQTDSDVPIFDSDAQTDQTVPEYDNESNFTDHNVENEVPESFQESTFTNNNIIKTEETLLSPRIEAVYQLKESPSIDDTKINKHIENHSDDKENKTDNSLVEDDDEQSYLTPNIEAEYELECSQSIDNIELDRKIQDIEKDILQQELLVKMYDEQEVTKDNKMSPYILSEKAKARIVELYQQLCSLTGQAAVKRRKIRLQVMEGHPSGPTRKLEEFLNNNIGENGEPPFPDFCDVVACVLEASSEYGLGWKKSQVMREASSLFVQCGQALQKRRQRREYRDLCSRVKAEPVGTGDGDPADEDPELRRKLEENRRRAVRKENELLERYTMMQNLPTQPKPGPSLDSTKNGVKPTAVEPSCSAVQDDCSRNQNGGNITQDQVDSACEVIITADSESDLDSSDHCENSDSENEISVNNTRNIHEPNDLETISTNKELGGNSDVLSSNSHSHSDVKIKKEPVDVAKLLDELGEDYMSSVIQIEDPYLVIEISSDSEYETIIETHEVETE